MAASPWICAACETAQLAACEQPHQWLHSSFCGRSANPARDVDSYGIKIRTDGGLGRLNPRKARRDLQRQNVETFNDNLIVPRARVPRKGTPNKEGQT